MSFPSWQPLGHEIELQAASGTQVVSQAHALPHTID
jgi:hypothetical protein